jgi:DNA polymerase III delta prime subunit
MNKTTPWVEKYRPNTFNNIVLTPINKSILNNIITKKYFPNLLFYGPPGTGKTTTIINVIKSFQGNNYDKNQIIHLNASDERGIDIIRNQIGTFVKSKSLFGNNMKFIILDEVDYMTKNAQIALKYLLHDVNNNVRFCLICNYISRIDEALQNEFVRLRFNNLPKEEIMTFLNKINKEEDLNFSNKIINYVQSQFNSDIRSMINYMQSNQHIKTDLKILTDDVWENVTKNIKKYSAITNNKKLIALSYEYNLSEANIIKNYLNFLIRRKLNVLPEKEFLNFVEFVTHIENNTTENLLFYVILKLKFFFES